jgi:hypothetical protein
VAVLLRRRKFVYKSAKYVVLRMLCYKNTLCYYVMRNCVARAGHLVTYCLDSAIMGCACRRNTAYGIWRNDVFGIARMEYQEGCEKAT